MVDCDVVGNCALVLIASGFDLQYHTRNEGLERVICELNFLLGCRAVHIEFKIFLVQLHIVLWCLGRAASHMKYDS